MLLIFPIFIKLVALFCLIILGIIAHKYLEIDRISIAKLVFYIISPIVFLHAISKLQFTPYILFLPLITAGISTLIAIGFFYFSRKYFDEGKRAILSFTSANPNVGYFLLPIVWEFFDEVAAGMYIVMVLGNSIYENTTGFFIASTNYRQFHYFEIS